MRRIIKKNPPHSLVTYINKIGASFEEKDNNVTEDLKNSLLDEQGWVCGYCQQKIKSKSRMKIEHHCEQSICNGQNNTKDRRLDYTNMLAVCKGNEGSKNLHCDSSKATFSKHNGLPIKLSPWIDAHINMIEYKSSGKIISKNTTHDYEIDKILNLNVGYLKEMRMTKQIKIWSFAKHTNSNIQKQKMKRLLEKDLVLPSLKFPNNFPGLSEYMLKKHCLS